MTKILMLLTVLCCFGCQTAKTSTDYSIEPKPKTITLKVTPANHPLEDTQEAYDIQLTVKTVDGKLCCPRISKPVNAWGSSSHVVDIQGFSYVTKALIGDEMVEIDCEPGMRATMKAIPLEVGYVRVKGMYVYNRLQNKDLSIPATVIPFNVIVKIGEPTVIYEMKMELEE